MSSLKKYRKLKYLGKGSYGAAILVELRADNRQKFVIKEIVIGHLSEKEQIAAKNEAEVLNQLSHSNITMYIESFIENSKLYIVMEYADGGDLSSAIKEQKKLSKRYPEDEIMRIFVQICLALRHVHQNNILHRDLKSQNIFLTAKAVVKLGDFGIAKALDATDDQAKTQIGTPYYLSPEICESRPYGRASDVWSLGVVLYELAALEMPFLAPSLPMLVQRICFSEPDYDKSKLADHYSSNFVNLIKSMLQKNPDSRPSVKDIIKSSYVKNHISELLSYTMHSGTGGAPLPTPVAPAIQKPIQRPIQRKQDNFSGDDEETDDEIEVVDRNIENLRQHKQRQEEVKKQISEQDSKIEMDRQGKRVEDRERLRKFKQDIIKKKDDNPTQQSNNSNQIQEINSKMASYQQQNSRIKSLAEIQYDRNLRSQIQLGSDEPNRDNQSSRNNNGAAVSRYQQEQQSYENKAREEFFKNRAAAMAVKQKVEQLMYGGGGGGGNGTTAANNFTQQQQAQVYQPSTAHQQYHQQQSYQQQHNGTAMNSNDNLSPEDRIAAIKAQKESHKQQELLDRQRELEKVREQNRAWNHQQRAKQSVAFSINFDIGQSEEPPSQQQVQRPSRQPSTQSDSNKVLPPVNNPKVQMNRNSSSEVPPPVNSNRGGWDKSRVQPSSQLNAPSLESLSNNNSSKEQSPPIQQSQQPPRRGWNRPTAGENISIAQVGVISIGDQNTDTTVTTTANVSSSSKRNTYQESKEEENVSDDERNFIQKLQQKRDNKDNARQQAREILRKLRNKNIDGNVKSNGLVDRSKLNSVMAGIQSACDSVNQVVSNSNNQFNRDRQRLQQEQSSKIEQESYSKYQSDRINEVDEEIVDESGELQRTIANYLEKNPKSRNHHPPKSSLSDTITTIEDNAKVFRDDLVRKGNNNGTDEIEDDCEVADLQCELAKALINDDDDD